VLLGFAEHDISLLNSAEISHPMNRKPSSMAAFPVEDEPANGSRMIPLRGVASRTNVHMRWTDLEVKWALNSDMQVIRSLRE